MRKDVYDVEIFPNCFTLTAVAVEDENDVLQFVIHESRNDLPALIDYLNTKGLKQIGFNNIGFDYPIIHLLIVRQHIFLKQTALQVCRALYDKAQELISEHDKGNFNRFVKPLIPQRDVFKIWHFDNKQRYSSLKWIQIAIGWKNVEEMPFHYNHWVEVDDIPKILSYNHNDSASTRAFYLHPKTQQKINIRYELSERFHLQLHNDNDVKMGEKIILRKLAEVYGLEDRVVREWSTKRTEIPITECILPYVCFESPQFERVHEIFDNMVINTTKKQNDISVIFDGMKYDFGFGGIHAARENETFSDVYTADVTSYYPRMAIENGFYPEHLGKEFIIAYDGIYVERTKWPKGNVINEGYKLALNGAFGKSNSVYSFLFDPKFTMQITINGQLLLAMLCEKLTLSGAARVIMANTDGIEIQVKNQVLCDEIFAWWQALTKLQLENGIYTKLAIRDVNNYIALKPDGKTKEKGDYEVEKDFYKDHSMRIVPMAVRENIKTGIPVRDYIMSNNEIGNYLMGMRAKTGKFYGRVQQSGVVSEIEMPRTIRYYVSDSGTILMKKTDKKNEKVHINQYSTMFNQWEDKPFDQYKVKKSFYVGKATELVLGTRKPENVLFS